LFRTLFIGGLRQVTWLTLGTDGWAAPADAFQAWVRLERGARRELVVGKPFDACLHFPVRKEERQERDHRDEDDNGQESRLHDPHSLVSRENKCGLGRSVPQLRSRPAGRKVLEEGRRVALFEESLLPKEDGYYPFYPIRKQNPAALRALINYLQTTPL
jgi:hypothetical protein